MESANDILGFRITDIMFNGTADDLKATRVTQPAVSSQIAALEDALGLELFQRGREVRLTPSGEIFLGYARKIQKAYDLTNNAFGSVFGK